MVLAWALYDFANQFFALNVIALYFPRWLTIEKGCPEIFYSISFGVSMFFVAIFAPILGSISDSTLRRKIFLVYFTLLSVFFTLSLGFSTNVMLALVFFAIANFGCQEAVVFYNALLVEVAKEGKVGFISGLGRMFGYSGAIFALYLSKPVIVKFGYQATFLLTAGLFLLFSLPCMILIKEKRIKTSLNLGYFFKKPQLIEIFKKLKNTALDSKKYPGFNNFLKAAFFWLCAVNAIILFMTVYATKVFGLGSLEVVDLLAFSTLFAILGSILSGFLSDWIGYKRTLFVVFFLWIACILAGALGSSPFHWLIGAFAGASLGATWVVFRAAVIELTGRESIGQAFGLFNLLGYLAGVIGPLFWGFMLLLLAPLGGRGYRFTLASLLLFVGLGFVFFLRIPQVTKAKLES